jgi:hypothetical protein
VLTPSTRQHRLPRCFWTPAVHGRDPLNRHGMGGLLFTAFCRDTAVWGGTDVPGKPLFTLRDTPRRPESIPRNLPAHELDAVVSAIYELQDPHQRAALLLARWSGARRNEIRRLTIDCLDTYSDGHPRLHWHSSRALLCREWRNRPATSCKRQPRLPFRDGRGLLRRHDVKGVVLM